MKNPQQISQRRQRQLANLVTVKIPLLAAVKSAGAIQKNKTVRDFFASAPFHHLLVIEEEHLVGILSDKDLYKALSPFLGSGSENQRDRDNLQRRVHQIMTRSPVTVSPQSSIAEACDLLLTHGISCLPVLENGQVVGIVTWRDLLRASTLFYHREKS